MCHYLMRSHLHKFDVNGKMHNGNGQGKGKGNGKARMAPTKYDKNMTIIRIVV